MNNKLREFCKKKKEDPHYFTEITIKDIIRPITVLLGPNGSGKSMSIRLMIQELKKKGNNVISYRTGCDDLSRQNPYNIELDHLMARFMSEGESMDYSFYKWLKEVAINSILNDRDKPLYIFIDEADSGLSIDKIYEGFFEFLIVLKEELKRGRKIYLILSANTFELAEFFVEDYSIVIYLWVPTKEYISLGAYGKFKRRYVEYYKEMNSNNEFKKTK